MNENIQLKISKREENKKNITTENNNECTFEELNQDIKNYYISKKDEIDTLLNLIKKTKSRHIFDTLLNLIEKTETYYEIIKWSEDHECSEIIFFIFENLGINIKAIKLLHELSGFNYDNARDLNNYFLATLSSDLLENIYSFEKNGEQVKITERKYE